MCIKGYVTTRRTVPTARTNHQTSAVLTNVRSATTDVRTVFASVLKVAVMVKNSVWMEAMKRTVQVRVKVISLPQ